MNLNDMASLEVVVRAKGLDPSEEEHTEWGNAIPLNLKRLLIVEGVTERGRTGLAFYLEDSDGEKYYANTTGRIINAMAMAVRGAMLRFGDNPDEA